MNKAYLGIGSNLGDKRQNIEAAVALLRAQEELIVTKISSYYETEPVGYLDQDWFFNCVLEIETSLKPRQLLLVCQAIETELKRERPIRFGPRTMDVDILLYEGYESLDVDLTVPHPRMAERSFILIPLKEIAGNIRIGENSLDELIDDLNKRDAGKIIKL